MLVDRYHAPVLRLAYRLTRDPEDAKDIAQDAFLRAFRSLGDVRPERPFARWLFVIARNASLDTIRRRRRTAAMAAELEEPPSELGAENVAGGRRAIASKRSIFRVAPSAEGTSRRMKVKLGVVGHFSLAVADPVKSAQWWMEHFDLEEIFAYEDGVGLSNDAITIALFKGKPNPGVLEHMSFHVANVKTLRAALDALKRAGVEIEDPGDEIGPEAPGSSNMGLWFHDLDGYRWELSAQGASG